jgi:hypothetical protein
MFRRLIELWRKAKHAFAVPAAYDCDDDDDDAVVVPVAEVTEDGPPPVAEAVTDYVAPIEGRSIRLLTADGKYNFLLRDFAVTWPRDWECTTRLGAIRHVSQSWTCSADEVLNGQVYPHWYTPDGHGRVVSVRIAYPAAARIVLTNLEGFRESLEEFCEVYGDLTRPSANPLIIEVRDGERTGRMVVDRLTLVSLSALVSIARRGGKSMAYIERTVIAAYEIGPADK